MSYDRRRDGVIQKKNTWGRIRIDMRGLLAAHPIKFKFVVGHGEYSTSTDFCQ